MELIFELGKIVDIYSLIEAKDMIINHMKFGVLLMMQDVLMKKNLQQQRLLDY